MATEHGLYITVSTIHNGNCFKRVTRQLEIAQCSPWPIYSHVENNYS